MFEIPKTSRMSSLGPPAGYTGAGRSLGAASRTGAASLEFRGVTKRYGQDEQAHGAVNDLSLEVPAGAICVLVGPSGCGKTTSLKMVNRLIEPTAGEILLNGVNVMTEDVTALRRRIGYVIQQVGLFPHLTVGRNVAVVPALVGWSKERQLARGDELLSLVGLDPASYRNRYPYQLSGGERQRVGVARALAADPPLMLMDEPFAAVDPIVRERLQDEFLRLQRDLAKTILFVTHDIDEAIKMGDFVAVMEEGGRLAQFGPPDEILAHPASDFVARFVGADRGAATGVGPGRAADLHPEHQAPGCAVGAAGGRFPRRRSSQRRGPAVRLRHRGRHCERAQGRSPAHRDPAGRGDRGGRKRRRRRRQSHRRRPLQRRRRRRQSHRRRR
jgi:osmoprotectant transport system ATP-binding protein